VYILQVVAKALGMTYEVVNIWIFVIIEPIIFIAMCFWIYRLYREIGKLKRGVSIQALSSNKNHTFKKRSTRKN
jgi:hypothetical protein